MLRVSHLDCIVRLAVFSQCVYGLRYNNQPTLTRRRRRRRSPGSENAALS